MWTISPHTVSVVAPLRGGCAVFRSFGPVSPMLAALLLLLVSVRRGFTLRIRFVEVNPGKGWIFISASSWFIVCVNALVRVDGVALIPGVGGPQGFVSHARVCQIHGIAMAVPTAAVSPAHVPAISNAFWLRVPFSTISFGSPPIQALAASGLVWPRGRFAVGRGPGPGPRPPHQQHSSGAGATPATSSRIGAGPDGLTGR